MKIQQRLGGFQCWSFFFLFSLFTKTKEAKKTKMFSPDWNLLHFLLADVIMCILCYKNRFLSDRVSQLEQQLDSQKREMEREAIVKNASLQSQVYEWEFKLHNFQNDLNKKTSQIQSINSRIINVRRELESNIDALRLLMLNSSQKKTEPSVSDPVV